jgi:hypothetical protein
MLVRAHAAGDAAHDDAEATFTHRNSSSFLIAIGPDCDRA